MHLCLNCGHHFNEPELCCTEDGDEYWGCPNCTSDNFDDVSDPRVEVGDNQFD